VLVAVSGGPDSMALLHLFSAVLPVVQCRIGVAHCNFTLRGEESEEDEAFVREHCRLAGFECHVRRFDTRKVSLAWKKSIEETARIQRYSFFEELQLELGYSRIATGHHSGDNAETMLFNLFRGSSMTALRGIRSVHGSVIRPLLPFSRDEIIAYLHESGRPWRTDLSNSGIEHDRNFIRNRVIPLIEERFRYKLTASLQRMSEHAGELDEFVEAHIGRLIDEHTGFDLAGGNLHVVSLLTLTLFERKEILKRALQSQGAKVDSRVLQRLVELTLQQAGRSVPVGGGIVAVSKDGFLRFRRESSPAGDPPEGPSAG